MKGFYSALFAAMLLAPVGAALANQSGDADSSMKSGKVGSAATKEGSMKPEGGTASGDGMQQGMNAKDDIPGGPDDDMSTQTGTANTEVGGTAVQGGSAAGDSEGKIPKDEQIEPEGGVDSAQDVDPAG